MSELLERAAKVKARWDMVQLIEQLTGETVPASHKINSIFNEADDTPSMHIYEDSFYCYSTGNYGDVIALVQKVKHCTFERAIQILEEEGDELGLEAVERQVAPKPVFVVPTGRLYDLDSIQHQLFGVTPELVGRLWRNRSAFGVLGTSDIAIIHRNPVTKLWIGIKYRHGDGKKTSEPGSDFSSFLYQPFDYYTVSNTCVITEGETDSWAWLSVRPDDHVYSLPSGAQSWKDKFLEQLEPYQTIWLAFDNDTAGDRAGDKVSLAVGYRRANRMNIPGLYNDVREAIAAGWKPTL